LPRTGYSGSDNATGAQVSDVDLFADASVTQSLARHTHTDGAAACADDDLITFANDLSQREMARCDHLLGRQCAGDLFASRLFKGGQVALAQQADVPFGQREVGDADLAVSLQWSAQDHDITKKAYLGRDKDGPGGDAIAANPCGDPADRLCGAFQRNRQFSVAGSEAQARVKPTDLDFMSSLNFATLQILANRLLKKALGRADKLVGRGACVTSQRTGKGQQPTEPGLRPPVAECV
jgi:hypothetical protein